MASGVTARRRRESLHRTLGGWLAVALAAPGFAAPPPNILVNNPAADTTTQDTQSGSALVLGAGGTILAAFDDSGSGAGGLSHFTGFARSVDGGDNWTDQGALPNSANGDAGWERLARSASTGTVLLSAAGYNSNDTIPVFRSTDQGVSYAAPIDGAAGGGDHDFPVLAVDNFAGAGQGTFYLLWRNFASGGGMTLSRSTDDGLSFTNRQLLTTATGQGAWVTVGADHAVYCFWLAASPNRILMRKSTNLGVSFGATVVTVATLRTGTTNGDLVLNGGFRTNSFVQAVANPADSQKLYAVFNDSAESGPDRGNIYLTQSSDGGATWSEPVQVNTDAGTNDQWLPVIAITPDGGGLFVSWYDRRLDPGNSLIHVFGRNGVIAGSTLTLGADYRITDVAFPVVRDQDSSVQSAYMGDHAAAAADNAMYYRTWGDNRLPLLTHAHQPDVRFTKIPRAGPGPIAGSAGASLLAQDCSPGNGALDPGETVTVAFGVSNNGSAPTGNLVGTLEPTGGVTNPSTPQSFGVIAAGTTVERPFTFQVSGACGATVTASLELHDPTTSFGTFTYPLPTGGPGAPLLFSNPGAIAINDNTTASPYPSAVAVAGFSGVVDNLIVTLNGLSHTFPEDIDILLVGPGGQTSMVLSDAGGGADVAGLDLTFSDGAPAAAPAPLVSGSYRPTNLGLGLGDTFVAPAPAGTHAASFAPFAGLSGAAVNGTWNLYVLDDVGVDTGSIAGGWTLGLALTECATSCGSPPPPALDFYTIAPCRAVDTDRPGNSPALQGGAQRDFQIADSGRASVCGIPAAAKAVVLNVTVVANADGDLNLFPQGIPQPASRTLHFRAAGARANNAVLALSPFGTGQLSALLSAGSARLIVDVTGYFAE